MSLETKTLTEFPIRNADLGQIAISLCLHNVNLIGSDSFHFSIACLIRITIFCRVMLRKLYVADYHHGHEGISTMQVFYLLSNITFDVGLLFNHFLLDSQCSCQQINSCLNIIWQ